MAVYKFIRGNYIGPQFRTQVVHPTARPHRIPRISRLVLRPVKFVPPGRSLERSQRNIKSPLRVDDARVSPSPSLFAEGESLSRTLTTQRNAS